MIVCSCNVLSDGAIKACLKDGDTCPRSVREVYTCLGCAPKCGRCADTIRALMDATAEQPAEAVVMERQLEDVA